MKRIFLEKITQGDTVFYAGKADPRDLVKMATEIEIGETQEAQRPLNGKRVKEIAKYVSEEKGMLATSVVLATKNDKISVQETNCSTNDGHTFKAYYIEIPTTAQEFDDYRNTLDVMDGQHRLYSFSDDYRLLKDAVNYEVNLSLFITPTLRERRLIFKNTNEKQQKVSPNLLMWFREQLNMLDGKEKKYYGLVSDLNSENVSPLQGRIIMSAEKIPNGIKAKALIDILDKAKFDRLTNKGNPLTGEQQVKVISSYLKAWEKVCQISFANPIPKVDGAATKPAGLRLLLLLLPTFWERAGQTGKVFDETFVVNTANQLLTDLQLEGIELFTSDETKLYFRGQTSIEAFAERCSDHIKEMGKEDIDLLAF